MLVSAWLKISVQGRDTIASASSFGKQSVAPSTRVPAKFQEADATAARRCCQEAPAHQPTLSWIGATRAARAALNGIGKPDANSL
jgi:hypothetical protein